LLTRGNLEAALSLDWDEVTARREQAWAAFRALVRDEEVAPLLRLWAYGPRGAVRDEIARTMEFFASFFRDILYVKEGGRPGGLLNPDAADRVEDAGRVLTGPDALRGLALVDGVLQGLDRNLNAALVVADFISRYTERTHARDHLSAVPAHG
jgi:hypothetical protein